MAWWLVSRITHKTTEMTRTLYKQNLVGERVLAQNRPHYIFFFCLALDKGMDPGNVSSLCLTLPDRAAFKWLVSMSVFDSTQIYNLWN